MINSLTFSFLFPKDVYPRSSSNHWLVYLGLSNGSALKESACNTGDKKVQAWSLNMEDNLEGEMANHSRILAWKIPWTEEPGGLMSTELQKSWTQLNN